MLILSCQSLVCDVRCFGTIGILRVCCNLYNIVHLSLSIKLEILRLTATAEYLRIYFVCIINTL